MKKIFLVAMILIMGLCVGCAGQGQNGYFIQQMAYQGLNVYNQQQQMEQNRLYQQQQMEQQRWYQQQQMELQREQIQRQNQQQYGQYDQGQYQQQQDGRYRQGQYPQQRYGQGQYQQQQNNQSNCQKKYIGQWRDQYGQTHPSYELRCY